MCDEYNTDQKNKAVVSLNGNETAGAAGNVSKRREDLSTPLA